MHDPDALLLLVAFGVVRPPRGRGGQRGDEAQDDQRGGRPPGAGRDVEEPGGGEAADGQLGEHRVQRVPHPDAVQRVLDVLTGQQLVDEVARRGCDLVQGGVVAIRSMSSKGRTGPPEVVVTGKSPVGPPR